MADHEMGEDQASPEPVAEGFSGVGQALATSARVERRARPEADYGRPQRRGQGRRVNLVRLSGGEYQIRLGRDRIVQGFCSDFEDITRFQLPAGIQQQVRINIEEVGEAREFNDNPGHFSDPPVPGMLHVDDGVALESIAHPAGNLPRWQVEALGHLEEEVARIRNLIDALQNFR